MPVSVINAVSETPSDPYAWCGVDDALKFPLPSNYPIVSVLLEDGTYKVVSRNDDDIWDFTETEGKISRIYIQNSKWNKKNHLSQKNVQIFRDSLGYFWLSDRQQITVSTLIQMAKPLRAFLAECSKRGMVATELYQHPRIASEIFETLTGKQAQIVIRLLAELFANRESLGFFILNPQTLYEISKLVPDKMSEQTPYIPVRIWNYQALRLTEFLNDFIGALGNFQALNDHLVDIYRNCGCADARKSDRSKNVSPFNQSNTEQYVGPFAEIARAFDVDKVVTKWMVSPGRNFDTICGQSGPRIISSYLTAVTYVGLLYLANFSGMRSDELVSLAKDSVIKEEDKDFGTIYFLKCGTTKTVVDKEALWVTTSFSEKVVDLLAEISLMRIACAAEFGRGIVDEDEALNPHLFMRAYEPWGLARGQALNMPVSLTKALRYGAWANYVPNLFDIGVLVITKEDFIEAKKYTPTLNPVKFAVGKPWPLAIHQLRRTLIVNAVEGGVSIFSTQYQAKHQSLIMTQVYARNHVGRRLSNQMKADFMDAVYASTISLAKDLSEDKYVSKYGAAHKARLIDFVDVTQSKALLDGAVNGSYSIRQTFYGLCFKKGHCPSGGISFVADCPSCAEGLGDKTKIPALKAVRAQVASQLPGVAPGSKLHESLDVQITILSSAIDFLEP
ncbi:hypothetical protein [Pseudomonas viridiflava]|uniref:hypothetical protein n=1 Tax=Pseudomonas viridiflava TaxID=33069 RepID=UPI001C31AA78|nr:hypothetical protein [Pseudomonas viridiflava]QXG47492.1 hypothetical protein KTT57_28770 [Pseudomonas viridiflava]